MGKPDWITNLESELQTKSDRALLSVLCSQMHNELTSLIEQHGGSNRLNANGNLNSTIIAAHKLGILSSEIADILHRIRKMRNQAEHEPEPVDLAHQQFDSKFREIKALLFNIRANDNTARDIAVMCGVSLVGSMVDAQRNKQIKEDQSGTPHECLIWILEGVVKSYAFEEGSREAW